MEESLFESCLSSSKPGTTSTHPGEGGAQPHGSKRLFCLAKWGDDAEESRGSAK